MFNRRAPAGTRVLLAAAIAAGAVGLAGCTGSGSHSPGGNATGANGVPMSTATGLFSADKLRGALLTRVNGVTPAGQVQSGSYSSLPEVRAAAKSMAALLVTPKGCGQAASVGGVGLDGLGSAPAAVVTFQVGANGVSEVLAAPADSAAAATLGTQVRAGCTHYRATSGGKTYQYAVQQAWVTGIGKQARMLSVSPAGQASRNVWSLVYRGDGFVGAVTVVGPNASEAAVRQLGQQAYAYAAKALHT
jgi:hypothetical protein